MSPMDETLSELGKDQTKADNESVTTSEKCTKCGKMNVLKENNSGICGICSDHHLAVEMAREFELSRRPTRSKLKIVEKHSRKIKDNDSKKRNTEDSLNAKDLLKSKQLDIFKEYSKMNKDSSHWKLSNVELPCNLGPLRIRKKVLNKDFYYSIGDIVCLKEDGKRYYAQIKCIVENEFCEKYAALIWLIPSTSSHLENGFEPDTYMYGPQDEKFYNITNMEFEMHAPTQYYKRFINPVPEVTKILHPVQYNIKSKRRKKM